MKTKAQQAIELRNQANTKLDEMNGLVEAAETRNADFTEQEQTDYDNLKKEVESLQRRAGRLEASAATEARQQAPATVIPGEAGGNSEKREKQKIISEYRFANVIKAKLENRPLDGLEAEMHQEAREEAKANGVTLDISGVAVPAFFISADKRWHRMSNTERRDMVAGTDTAGGHTIETDLGELIPALRPKLKVVEMGATMLGGLQGNLDIPRQTTVTTATWKAENAAAAETTPAFDKISFTPNRLTAYTNVSNTLLAQSAIVTEGFVRRDLEIAVQTALDLAAINGSGTAPEPKGILNFAGIGSVAGGTNGAAPTLGNIIDLETEIAKDNADVANMAYLTTPGIRGKLKKTALDAGSGRFIWEGMELNGYAAHVSTQVPSDLTKGSSTDCHAIIFGNWAELLIGQWGGINIIVNPYTNAKQDLVEIVVHSYWDLDLRHEQSFAAMKDALLV